MSTAQDRIDALSRYLATTDTGARPLEPAPVTATGNVVEAGGTIERILVTDAQLAYAAGGAMHYPKAGPGDTILVSARQAERLDRLGATVETLAELEEVAELRADGLLTDEQIKTGTAEDLIAYVAQNPDERPRVRAIEELRRKKARATVMAATEPTPEADLAAEAEAANRAPVVETPAGDGTGDDDPDLIVE